MFDRLHSRLVLAGAALWAAAGVGLACGPDFPPTILDRADDYLQTMPEADFCAEIHNLLPATADGARTNRVATEDAGSGDSQWLNTVRADVADLQAALRASSSDEAAAGRLVEAYRAFRIQSGDEEAGLARWSHVAGSPPGVTATVTREPPAGLPREFAYYARGAVAYRLGMVDRARDWWRLLLRLPPGERRFRSTWAAYMLGRALPPDETPAAVAWYRLVRDFAAHGYHDSLGLATESLGWEAQVELNEGRYERAAELYLAQRGEGDGGALVSLQVLARRVLEAGTDRIEAAARDPRLQRVITAYLVSRNAPWAEAPSAEESAFWLAALEHGGLHPVDGADRLAWLAYQQGNFDGAVRWLTVAPTNSLTARWLQAKLSLRNGDQARAQAILESLVRGLDAGIALPSFVFTERARGQQPGSQAAGELAALLMRGGRYADALDLLLRHGWWTDSAYVGERVLTADELRAYVDRVWPVQPPDSSAPSDWWSRQDFTQTNSAAYAIRYLLARRLMREGRGGEAFGYYPFLWRERARQYGDCLARGRDTRRPVAERATRLWRAARLMRYLGMELSGTETDPDWHAWGGMFDLGVFGEPRTGTNGPALAQVRPDERQRARKHTTVPDKRFHYRYRAADLGWEAAALLPDDSGVTAQVLCEAGSWLKIRDPKAADGFYKALVRRCGKTELGLAAAQLRWFPPVDLRGIPVEEKADQER